MGASHGTRKVKAHFREVSLPLKWSVFLPSNDELVLKQVPADGQPVKNNVGAGDYHESRRDGLYEG